ncbi:MAG: MFS transporter [Luteolibacter sp.]
MTHKRHTILLVLVASLGGLLYGYDLGIISAALLYLGDCMKLSEDQTGLLASAIMIGALASSVVGGGLSDLLGRKKAMLASAFLFVISVVVIVTSHGFWTLFFGRTLQGLSAGMIAVVVPVYMTESAPLKIRGRTSTMFQFCITLGIAVAMAAGAGYQSGVDIAVKLAAGHADQIAQIKDHAWRMMFVSSAYPAVAFVLVAIAVAESPRWLFRHGKKDAAFAVLLQKCPREEAELELKEMEDLTTGSHHPTNVGLAGLFQKRYLKPLLLAVTLLAINQATGICAVLTYPVVMLSQSGMSESMAAKASVWLAVTSCIVTIPGVLLVDKLGRKLLLKIGTGVILVALAAGMFIYWKTEAHRTDVTARLTAAIQSDGANQTLTIPIKNIAPSDAAVVQVTVQYKIDGKEQAPLLVRGDAAEPVLHLKNDGHGTIQILRAKFSPAPSEATGKLIFACLLVYISGFAFGPGVCLWLMSAELLPTRVRSLGMGIGVLANAGVTVATTSLFLPIVGSFGYAAMWGCWFGCTLAYGLFAAFILPETKGRTLEEIEESFAE